MGDRVSVVVVSNHGVNVAGEWDTPRPDTRSFDEAALAIGRAVLEQLYDPATVAVQVMPSAVLRRHRTDLESVTGPGDIVRATTPSSILRWWQGASAGLLGPSDIVRVTCAAYVLEERVFWRSNDRRVAEARFMAMYLVRDLLGLSYPAIGKLFDRDHTTIVHGVQRVRKWLLDRGDVQTRMDWMLNALRVESVTTTAPAEAVAK